jgi:fatty acid desaturase
MIAQSLKGAIDDEALVRACRHPPPAMVWKPLIYLVLLGLSTVAGSRLLEPWNLLAQTFAAANAVLLYTILHDASHYHVSANGRLNNFVGGCVALVLGTSLTAYRVTHLRHHGRLRTPDDPQEAVYIKPESQVITALALMLAAVVGAAFFLLARVPRVGLQSARHRWRVVGELTAALALHATVVWVLWHTQPAVFVSLIRVACLATVLGSLLDINYHQGFPIPYEGLASRSFDSPRLVGWLLNGHNRHAEHHAFPWIPTCNLNRISPKVRQLLIENGAIYEPGYLHTLIRCVIVNPLFLPPSRHHSAKVTTPEEGSV